MKYLVELNDREAFFTGDPMDEIVKRCPDAIIELRLLSTRPIIGGVLTTWAVYADHRHLGKIFRKYK